MKNIYVLPAVFFLIGLNVSGQIVGPDPGFGNNGLVITDLKKYLFNSFGRDLLLQPDGKLILGGEFTPGNDVLRRYHPDGALDTTFQLEGPIDFYKYGLGFQGNDKLLFYHPPFLERLDISGKPDSTFGENGSVNLLYHTGFSAGLTLQPDGKILVWGDSKKIDLTSTKFYLSRVTPDGKIDSTFADNGIFWFIAGNNLDIPFGVTVLADGKILMGGITSMFGWQIVMLRLHPDGMIDSTFGTNGHFITALKQSAEMYGMAVQPDNKIVITGYTRLNNVSEAFVARFNPEGAPDSTFGDLGVRYFPEIYEGYDIAIKPDNKIVFCGVESDTGRIVVVQLLENGLNDPGFGNSGVYAYPHTSLASRSLALADTNRIIISGSQTSTDNKGVLVSILTDLTLGAEFWGDDFHPAMWVYPNPVSDYLHVRFQLTKKETLDIALLDINSRPVATFHSGSNFEAGEHELSLNIPGGLPSGTYFLRLSGKGKNAVIRLFRN